MIKNFARISILLFFCCSLFGQSQSKLDIALRHLEANHKHMGLVSADYADMEVIWQNTDVKGITYVHLGQTVKGIPIKNAILSYTISPQGKVAFVGNTFVDNKNEKVVRAQEKIDIAKGITFGIQHLGYTDIKSPRVTNREGKKVEFESHKLFRQNVKGGKMYELVGEQLIPVWEYVMNMSDNADYWELRVSAIDGKTTSKNNYTIYCRHEHGKYGRPHKCEDEEIAKKQDTAVPLSTVLNAQGTYRVFALPAESPIHGPHKLVTDPHYIEASPFGWHDTDGVAGAEFTTTRGNNVDAFTDLNDDDNKDALFPQPEGGATLNFDYPFSALKDSTGNANAAVTNLFYMTNMMHDISALYGFTEEAGNFQLKNYSGKGSGNDYVNAQAFDGFTASPRKLDNANFSPTPDGVNGRMQMYLWTAPSAAVKINSPADVEGSILEFGTAQFGDPIPPANGKPIMGNLIDAIDNNPSAPTEGCTSIKNDLTGKIALIDRGGCNFSLKVKNAEDKGAIAVIICNVAGVNGGTGEEISNMSAAAGIPVPKKIPSVFMKKSDCDRLRLVFRGGRDVNMTLQEPTNSGPKYLDASFDNGIIAHEYGHGISNRLTNPLIASCLRNKEQMGEGWADFFALVTTVEAGDKGTDPRGIGTYAQGETVNGRGIRRFQYSTNRAINPQSYKDIRGNEDANGVVIPHPVGEVWVDMLWDLYWKMADKYGFDPNIKNINSGNGKAIQLVMQGLKMQGCSPGFIRGRNAILAADSLLFGGANTYDIWDVFAARGLGFYADGGKENDINDGKENFDTNPYKIELLKINKEEISLAKPNAVIDVTITTDNHVRSTVNGVKVTDALPTGFSMVSANVPYTVANNTVTFNLGNQAFDKNDTIRYKMRASNVNSKSLVKYGFEGNEQGWTVDALAGTSTFQLTDVAKNSGNESFYMFADVTESDQVLISPSFKVDGQNPALKFWQLYDTEEGNDGGFLEVSTDGGTVFTPIRDGFIKNGYNSLINFTTNAIPNNFGFTGTTNGKFIDSYLDLSKWKGQNIKIRFRFGTNTAVTSKATFPGWFIDDVEMVDLVVYNTQACISNSENSKGTCSVERKIIMDSQFSTPTNDLTQELDYRIYPNPTSNRLSLEINNKKAMDLEINITKLDGMVVSKKTIQTNSGANNFELDVNGLPDGMYILKMSNEGNSTSTKFIVQK
jgi:extracellular elastinolytic metalloproteinase